MGKIKQSLRGDGYILECNDLCKAYPSVLALDRVNLKIERGGVVGLLGPNGSGKSTLIKLAMGMLRPTAGEILIGGLPPCPATKAAVAYLPDTNFLSGRMRVEQALAYSADFFADFDKEKALSMLFRLGISPKQPIRTLSKGTRDKLGLILTMSRAAQLYILDEPIAGVDPAARQFILDFVLSNKPEHSTVFLCTHLLSDVEPVLTRAVFLNCGRIVLDKGVKELLKESGKSLDELFREVFRW